MASSLAVERAIRAKVEAAESILRCLPSLNSLAFLLPLALLYWQVAGPSALLTDPITGVDIRAGKWILRHHAIPQQGLFSFTLVRRAWCDWEWLSDLVYALLDRIHGLSAVVAIHLFLLCLTSAIVYRTVRLHAGRVIAFAVTYLVMGTTTIHWLARPHLFTWLLVALFAFLLERAEVTGNSRSLVTLPLLMILWVNLHPGFVAGLLVLGVWSASSLLRWWFADNAGDTARRKGRAVWICLTLAACLAATLANPYFWRLDAHIVSYLFSSTSVTSHVAEWLSPDFHNPSLDCFELLLPLAGAAGLWQGLRGHFAHCALVFGWMHLALVSVRNVPLFAIVCAAPLAAAGERFLRQCKFSKELHMCETILASQRSRRGTGAVYGLACALLAGIFWWGPTRFGPSSSLPVNAVRHLPAGRLFTTDRWADFLVYIDPDRQVFFDGRNDAYGEKALDDYLTVMGTQSGWEKILFRYGISVALVPRGSSISAALAASPEWTLTCQDRTASIYVRSGWVQSRSQASHRT